ncbi:sensor histidine kinase [Syntrophobotulus glycolicus]|nr:HAMP domain-containing sensor histidine kinase [Syntrophobotulus glycolicus]
MKNERRTVIPIKMIFKIILFPIVLVKLCNQTLKEKTEYSIRLKLSLRYLKILLTTSLVSGIGVILVFTGIKIQAGVAQDYLGLAPLLNKGRIENAEIKAYSREHLIPIQVYDFNNGLIFASETDLLEQTGPSQIVPVWTKDQFFLPVKKTVLSSGTLITVVLYSDIKGELLEAYQLGRIIFYVFSVALLFSVWAVILSGRGIFQSIGEMTQTVRDISERNLNLRLNVSGSKNELRELALTFNEMMNRIEDQYNKQKQFVSDASHELRTPIAVIQGYAVMLDRWGKDNREVLRESIEAIKNESENMNGLIDKLLFLARHDNNTFVFQKEEFSLTEMLQEIGKETQIIDTIHKINLEIEKEISVYADRNMLKQAVRIFIDNAIKYTPPGGAVSISLDIKEKSTEISIRDSGIGMTKAELEKIFDRFYRSDQSRTKDKGGHGLGLAIAKTIILGHKGKIRVRSKVGEGSEFILILDRIQHA